MQQQQQVAWDKTLQADAKEAFAVLNNRLDQGFNSLNEVTSHFGARARLETEYSTNFQGLLKTSAFKADQGTLKDALDKLIASSDNLSNLHVTFAKKLISDVDVPLNKFKQTQRTLKKYHENEIDKASKAAAKEVANVEKIKKDYYAKCNGMKQAVLVAAKGQTDKMTKKEYEKIQEKAIKAKKDVDNAELEYKNAVKKYDEVQDALDETLVVACREIQANENERYALIKSTLMQLVEAHIQMLSEQSAQTYQEALQSIKAINTDKDLNEWVNKSCAGSTKTARLTFQSFFGEKKTLNRAGSFKNISPVSEQKINEQIPKSAVQGNTARNQAGSTSNLAKSRVVVPEPEADDQPAQAEQTEAQTSVDANRPLSDAPSVLSEASTLVEPAPRKLTVETKPTEADRESFMQKPADQVKAIAEEPGQAAVPQQLDSGVAVSPEDKKGSLNNVSISSSSARKEPTPAISKQEPPVQAVSQEAVHTVVKQEPQTSLASQPSARSLFSSKTSQPKLDEPAVQPQPHVESKATQPDPQKADVKAETKQESKPEAKSEGKLENNPEAKVEAASAATSQPEQNAAAGVNSALKERQFSRRSIKMEGWLDVCDDSVKTWVKRWCALEGGYIWFFESQADNSKAQGQNKPKSMASVAKSTIVKGNAISGWQVPDVASKGSNLLTIVIGGKRQMLLACHDAEECAYWLEQIEVINKKK